MHHLACTALARGVQEWASLSIGTLWGSEILCKPERYIRLAKRQHLAMPANVSFQCVPLVRTYRRARGSSGRACRAPWVPTAMRLEPRAARTARCGERPRPCRRPQHPPVVSSTSQFYFPK